MKKISTQLTLAFLICFASNAMASCDASWGNYHGNNPDSIHFYPSSTTNNGWLWTFGDGDSSYMQYPWHEYTVAGTYTVCLTVHDSVSNTYCTHCDTVIIPSTSSCNAQWSNYNLSSNADSVHFYPTSSGATGYSWTFGDSSGSTSQAPWHQFPGPGTYTVCLTAYYSSDTCTWCDTVIVPAPSPCNAEFVHYPLGNNPDSIHFYPYTTNAIGYFWSFGDSTTSTLLNPTHVFPGPGTYTVCLTIHDATSGYCTWCDTVIVPSGSPCNAQWTDYYNTNNLDSVHFLATESGALAYYWNFGDSTTATGQYPWHQFPGPGTYNVCLTVHDASGYCTYCDTVIVPVVSTCNAGWVNYNIGNPDSVHFYPNSTSALGYYWNFGDNTSSTVLNPWHVFPGPGTYNVCLTVYYSTDTCTHCDTVIVTGTSPCNAQWGNYNLSSHPDSVHFYPSTTGALGYYWSFGDSTASTDQYPWHQFPGPGTYTVCLTIHVSSGYCTYCDTVVVPGTPPCNAAFVHYQVGSNPDSIHFYPYSTSALGYYWSFGDNTYSNILNPTHVYPGPGTYIACLTVFYSNDTCTWCDSVVIAGSPPCNSEFSYYTISNPDSVHFYPTHSGAIAWHWTFGDGNTSSLQYPWHYYSSPGTYYVCLTSYYSSGSCTSCDTVTIGNTSCNTHFSHYTLSNADSLHFYPTGNSALSYHWDFGDGDTSNLQYPWHQYAAPGTYYVCLTSHYSTYSCTWCDSVTVVSSPSCNAQFSWYFMSNPDSVHFYPTVTGASGYYWNFGDSTTSTLTYPWHEFPGPGTYTVCLVAHFSSGYCTWCDTITIGTTNVYYQLAENPLLDKFVFEAPVSVPEIFLQGQNILVFPNPATDYLNISSSNSGLHFILYDSMGKDVLDANLSEADSKVSTDKLSPGFYFYIALSKDRVVGKGKVIILR